MALAHPTPSFSSARRSAASGLNWRLIVAIGGTATFWIAIVEGVARLA